MYIHDDSRIAYMYVYGEADGVDGTYDRFFNSEFWCEEALDVYNELVKSIIRVKPDRNALSAFLELMIARAFAYRHDGPFDKVWYIDEMRKDEVKAMEYATRKWHEEHPDWHVNGW